MFILLNTLWFIWEIKYVLFWLYLWQLKDYHLARFLDHFNTHKGKKLIFNFSHILKLALLFSLLLSSGIFAYIFSILFLAYLIQDIILARAILNKSIKKPVRTAKTIFLTIVSFIPLILIWARAQQIIYLLIFDLLTPIIISIIVLFFQPFFVLLRNRTLGQAREKIRKIKLQGKLKVVAITGSYGKTTTKDFLATILSQKFKVLKTKEHQNSEIGVAKCILNDLNADHEIFIAEVGAYDKGKVSEVCSVLSPDIGIVTGVNEQHLALFGSMDNLLSAEGGREMAASLKNGFLIVNGDNKYCIDLYKNFGGKKKLYSQDNKKIDCDIWADSITVHKNYLSFLAVNKSGELAPFEAKVLGKQNVQNLLAAILASHEFGMSFGGISEACKNISQSQAGMLLRNGKHGIDIIDSSYSANPNGVPADLDYLSVFKGKRLIVMPCLIELGKRSAEIHEKIGQKIAEVCDLAVITSKDKFKEIKKGAMELGMPEKNILFCDNAHDIYSIITLFCKQGDAVLLEGRVPAELINLLLQ